MELDFSKYKELNEKNVLNSINEYSIYCHYLGYNPKIGRVYLSPFRKDTRPSFGLFYSANSLMYNDFGIGGGGVIHFVMKLFNLSYWNSLRKINQDFNLGLDGSKIKLTTETKIISTPIYNKEEVELIIKKKSFTLYDYDYWESFGISRNTLSLYNVTAVDRAWYKKESFKIPVELFSYKRNNPIFAYCFTNNKYKLYRPLSDVMKWISNVTYENIQGYTQLPNKGKLLLITSSLKDVMCLYDLGYLAIAPASESSNIPENIIIDIKSRFERILSLYDNDEPGQRYALKLKEKHEIEPIFLDISYGHKDPSDFYKKEGKDKTKLIIESLINK